MKRISMDQWTILQEERIKRLVKTCLSVKYVTVKEHGSERVLAHPCGHCVVCVSEREAMKRFEVVKD